MHSTLAATHRKLAKIRVDDNSKSDTPEQLDEKTDEAGKQRQPRWG